MADVTIQRTSDGDGRSNGHSEAQSTCAAECSEPDLTLFAEWENTCFGKGFCLVLGKEGKVVRSLETRLTHEQHLFELFNQIADRFQTIVLSAMQTRLSHLWRYMVSYNFCRGLGYISMDS